MTLQQSRPASPAPDARAVLDSFEGLRVTDVCDGMDALGMHDMGQMSRDIRPLRRDTDTFAHRIYGLAHTVRFVPTQRPVPDQTPDEFYDWMRNWYGTLARGPFVEQIRPRDLIVIDGYELGSTGFIGSNNALSWIAAGAVGVVDGEVTGEELTFFAHRVHLQFVSADPLVQSELVYRGRPASNELVTEARRHGVRLRSFIDYQGLVDLRPLAARQAANRPAPDSR